MDIKCKIGKMEIKNPIMAASGTFGNGEEFDDFVDIKGLGAIVTKTITLEERQGNPTPRIVETPSGMLNSIGLENNGAKHFAGTILPRIKKIGTKIIVSIAGSCPEEYAACVQCFNKNNQPDAFEVNLSCPNVAHRGAKHKLFAQDPEITEKMIKKVKKAASIPVIAKLTPNVTDITQIAVAAERGGADAVALVNTYFGMAIDAKNKKALLGNVFGGLSGPAIKPMALKAVYDAYSAIKIPIIGIGGIMNAEDVVEFLLAGAAAVQVGTANFVDPACTGKILGDLKKYFKKEKIASIKNLIGKAHK